MRTVSSGMSPSTQSRATPHSHPGLSYQTWLLGLHRAQGFSVVQFLYKERKMQIIIFFYMSPPHFQVAKAETQTGLDAALTWGRADLCLSFQRITVCREQLPRRTTMLENNYLLYSLCWGQLLLQPVGDLRSGSFWEAPSAHALTR